VKADLLHSAQDTGWRPGRRLPLLGGFEEEPAAVLVLLAICSGLGCSKHRQRVGRMRVWDPLQQWVMYSVRSELFFFDERPLAHISSSLIHGLYIHCTYYTLRFPLHLTQAQPGKPPQLRTPPPTPRGTSTRDNEDEDPAHPSLSLGSQSTVLYPNLLPSISGSTLCPPIGRIPGLRPSTFPFYLTSPPAAGITQSSPFTLARIHISRHAPSSTAN